MTTLISLEWYSLWNKHQCFRNNLWKCPLTFKVYSILFEQNKYLYTCQLQCNFVKAIWVCGFLMTIRLNRLKKTSNNITVEFPVFFVNFGYISRYSLSNLTWHSSYYTIRDLVSYIYMYNEKRTEIPLKKLLHLFDSDWTPTCQKLH